MVFVFNRKIKQTEQKQQDRIISVDHKLGNQDFSQTNQKNMEPPNCERQQKSNKQKQPAFRLEHRNIIRRKHLKKRNRQMEKKHRDVK